MMTLSGVTELQHNDSYTDFLWSVNEEWRSKKEVRGCWTELSPPFTDRLSRVAVVGCIECLSLLYTPIQLQSDVLSRWLKLSRNTRLATWS